MPIPTAPVEAVRRAGLDRRRFLAFFSACGLGATAFPEALWSEVSGAGEITREALTGAEKIAGLEFTDAERQLMLEGLGELVESYRQLRQLALPNDLPPAFEFNPLLPGVTLSAPRLQAGRSRPAPPAPPAASPAELPWLPVSRLAGMIRSRSISSLELTRIYLDRLKRWGPALECVVTLTEELALEQADRADRELAAGRYRGPLHGIPWGAKDLLSTRGYPTTWGALPYRGRVIAEDATVVTRLAQAGAVLVAKLTLGALAWGDVWFGGKTRNPWKPEQGSSGSSAGSAAATAAGLVGFSIGSETWGSIVSPCTRCGASGLRPTFGRVSRYGAMTLSWTMDKLGPICRTVEDCGLVLEAIHGSDGRDPAALDLPFVADSGLDPRSLRVGYARKLFEDQPEEGREESRAHDLETLETLRGLGLELRPIDLPQLPVAALSFILSAEAAAVFDELTRSGKDDELVRQVEQAWPNVLRQARLIPAVEYIQANRVRTLLMRAMQESMSGIDLYVAPSFGGDNLLLTNLTGHPAVVLPNGFRADGTPTSITLIGRLYAEAELLAVAGAYQQATNFHLRRPRLTDRRG